MIMKKIVLFVLALGLGLAAGAQNAKTYSDKYDKMVGILGPAGVGMETILNGWEKADSTDAKMLKARCNAAGGSFKFETKLFCRHTGTNRFLGNHKCLSCDPPGNLHKRDLLGILNNKHILNFKRSYCSARYFLNPSYTVYKF